MERGYICYLLDGRHHSSLAAIPEGLSEGHSPVHRIDGQTSCRQCRVKAHFDHNSLLSHGPYTRCAHSLYRAVRDSEKMLPKRSSPPRPIHVYMLGHCTTMKSVRNTPVVAHSEQSPPGPTNQSINPQRQFISQTGPGQARPEPRIPKINHEEEKS